MPKCRTTDLCQWKKAIHGYQSGDVGKTGRNKIKHATALSPTLGESECLREATAEEASHSQDEVHQVLEGGLAGERVVQDLLEHSQRVDVVKHSLTGDCVAGLPIKVERLASSLL